MAQQMIATGNRPAPRQAAMIPTTNATIPEAGDNVVSTMAGKVITANVT